jgi:hypothetical protein
VLTVAVLRKSRRSIPLVSSVVLKNSTLVRLGYSLVTHQVAYIDAALRKHKFCGRGALLRTLVPAVALAAHITDRYSLRFQ